CNQRAQSFMNGRSPLHGFSSTSAGLGVIASGRNNAALRVGEFAAAESNRTWPPAHPANVTMSTGMKRRISRFSKHGRVGSRSLIAFFVIRAGASLSPRGRASRRWRDVPRVSSRNGEHSTSASELEMSVDADRPAGRILAQRVEYRLGVLEVWRVEALGEP